MTGQQMKRSVVFTFVNTSCWTFEFNAECLPGENCNSGTMGSNLLFSGGASQIVQQGSTECMPEEGERRDLRDDRRELSGTNIVQGSGQVTMNFDTSRRHRRLGTS